jgi:predicted amidohydrolase
MAARAARQTSSVEQSPVARDMGLVLVQPVDWHDDGVANLRAAADALRDVGPFDERHLVVLPELVGATLPTPTYLAELRELVAATGAWLVGGSHYSTTGRRMNGGLVLDPGGDVVDGYEKRNPYGVELDHGVLPGDRHASFPIGGRTVTVMICADAWFAELLLDPPARTDLIVVPSFSITRRPPAFSQALWRHLAVARAYEFNAYVAVSDYRVGAMFHGAPSAGVSGVADPWPTEPDRYFTAAADSAVWVHRLDFPRLDALRNDRIARGFARVTADLSARRLRGGGP